jgi:uncharacterized protein (TIGR03437 family)
LTFAAQSGGSAPLPQTLSITSISPANISVSLSTGSGGNWLSVTPTGAATPASLSVAANPAGLANGTYSGSITISVSGDPSKTQTVQVTLLVGSQAVLVVNPATLTFTAQVGSSTAFSKALSLSTTGPALNYRVVLSQGSWFSVKPAFGSTPANLNILVDPTGLPEGTYTANISVAADGASNSPLSEKVVLTITPPPPTIAAVTDGASSTPITVLSPGQSVTPLLNTPEPNAAQGAGLAPGSIITIWGDNLGPEIAVPLSLTSSGSLATSLADTTVIIDGQPVPLLMVQKNQINAITPYSVDGKTSATLQITRKGATSLTAQVAVVPAAPALFTNDMTGKGQGAILNQDTSANSSSNPADKGSIVVLWGEGSGQSDPAGVDGFITLPSLLPKPLLPVSVLIGGQPAEILYQGAAPDLVSGVMQINVRVPAGVASGDVPVVVNVGPFSSQPGVTVAVR